MLRRCKYCKSIWVKWNIPCWNKTLYFLHKCFDCDELFRTDKFVLFGLPQWFVIEFYSKFVHHFTKKCKAGNNCYPICDLCQHYNFNGKTIGGLPGVYVGNGFCNLLKVKKEPSDYCSRFECKSRKKKNENSNPG